MHLLFACSGETHEKTHVLHIDRMVILAFSALCYDKKMQHHDKSEYFLQIYTMNTRFKNK